jgi:hypothetical protein
MGLNNKGDELDSVKWEKYAVGKGGFSCSLIRVSTHFFLLFSQFFFLLCIGLVLRLASFMETNWQPTGIFLVGIFHFQESLLSGCAISGRF